MNKTSIGNFEVDVEVTADGLLDVWFSHDGNTGSHHTGITSEEAGSLLADYIECIAESSEVACQKARPKRKWCMIGSQGGRWDEPCAISQLAKRIRESYDETYDPNKPEDAIVLSEFEMYRKDDRRTVHWGSNINIFEEIIFSTKEDAVQCALSRAADHIRQFVREAYHPEDPEDAAALKEFNLIRDDDRKVVDWGIDTDIAKEGYCCAEESIAFVAYNEWIAYEVNAIQC